MTDQDVDRLVACFRRRMVFATAARWALVVAMLVAFFAGGFFEPAGQARTAPFALGVILLAWLALVFLSLRTARSVQTAMLLIASQQYDDAEQMLDDALRGISIFRNTLLVACQHLGILLHAREHHAQASTVFRAILRTARVRTGRVRSLEASIRLQLADTELSLGRLPETYEAFHPIFGAPLSLAQRLALLPIELRYALATDHTRHAVEDLREKIRYAELLDATEAAWVHALLAEACRREGMTVQAEFLRRRAGLYHDLDDLPKTLSADKLLA